ncbi:AraC-type DNA-binding protein [Sinomicrobium oceani]|uniref:AraC-type DNA-binding protein n=1 Tax=Sinomicrobium oceani TaxID=1150368 RepID=A0A1K1QCM1_9FLAO|nr:AraC family transcriptional regulator [Sinomicrobium oceani]SFW57672.1 AraC-type DNA-binding protein [Sinomicrobium oceani]
MRFSLRTSDLQELIYERELAPDYQVLSGMAETEFGFDMVSGNGRYRELWFEGIHITYGVSHTIHDIKLKADCDTPVIEMHFAISGSSSAGSSGNPASWATFNRGEHNLFYMPYFDGYFYHPRQKEPSEMLEIHLSEKFLKRVTEGHSQLTDRFLAAVENKRASFLHGKNRKITPEMQMVLHQIIHCDKKGTLKRFYIEAKVLELLMLQLEDYHSGIAHPEILLRSDVEKLHHVKTMLETNFEDHYSLPTLARYSGMNEFKLKKGFKSLFGTTVFGYLRDIRLREAYRQLLDGQSTIQEIAEYCGYSTPQYFTTAFRRKYGISPGRLRNG